MNVSEDPKEFMSSIENQESVREAEVIINTDINITEVTTYKQNSDISSDQDMSNYQQTLSGTVWCVKQNYLIKGNLSIPNLMDGVLPCSTDVRGMI